MRLFTYLAAAVLCAAALPVHAQFEAGPVLVLGPNAPNRANVIACLPDFTVAGQAGPCTVTVNTPNLPDLVCIRLVNFKTTAAVLPVVGTPVLPPPGLAGCVLASPNTQVNITYPRPNFGSGTIIASFGAVRSGGGLSNVSGFFMIPDLSVPRFINIGACPLRQFDSTVPKPDPFCPQPGNDVNPVEFTDF